MGRSRDGLTSKIRAIVDAEGCLINLCLTGGQVADCSQAEGLLACIKEGGTLLADKAYDTDAVRKTAKYGPTFLTNPTARPSSCFRHGCIAREIWLSVSG